MEGDITVDSSVEELLSYVEETERLIDANWENVWKPWRFLQFHRNYKAISLRLKLCGYVLDAQEARRRSS